MCCSFVGENLELLKGKSEGREGGEVVVEGVPQLSYQYSFRDKRL